MSSDSLCHGLVLNIHSVTKIQIQASFAIKMKTVDGLQHEMKKLSLFKQNFTLINRSSTVSQMSSNSLCHGLALKIHVVEQIQT